jgi:hypothetical protein
MALTQDHVVGGGIVAVVTTNLPAVITSAPHWLGPDAPALQETALLVGIGAAFYGIARRLFVARPPRPVAPPAAEPQPKPAALSMPPVAPPAAPAPLT